MLFNTRFMLIEKTNFTIQIKHYIVIETRICFYNNGILNEALKFPYMFKMLNKKVNKLSYNTINYKILL